ncbi:MAG: hypothetical protein ACKOS8_04490 [Gemmataceae bacterium]
MSNRFRPRLEGLETRSVPASLFASALEWVPNPAADAHTRVMEQQPEATAPATAVLWDAPPGASVALAAPNADDSVWVGFQSEHLGYGPENLLTDWLFAENSHQTA